MRDSRSLHRASLIPAQKPSPLGSRTWALCSLVGPRTGQRGVYGTDLGFTVKQPNTGRLAMLFGDTVAKPIEGCEYPVFHSDDLQGSLPATRPAVLRAGPPTGPEATACQSFQYRFRDPKEPTSWERIRLFADASGKESAVMDTGLLRTPVTAFSDGRRVYGIFLRGDPAYCKRTTECPAGMACSSDPGFRGKAPGVCAEPPVHPSRDPAPTFCRDGSECGPLLECKALERGVCLASRAYPTRAQESIVTPAWYEKDPRMALAQTLYIGAAQGAAQPADYVVVQRFVTNRFVNVSARSVAHFDPEHPEQNDYRPGHHTLLIWGRPAFVAAPGSQSLPFLLYAPLSEFQNAEGVHFEPHFFAGYDAAGNPRWSLRESDAQPIYGTEATITHEAATTRLHWQEPEFDYVNQMSVSFVEPLGRWVMFYGGDAPGFMVMGASSGKAREPVHPEPTPGAIHMRTAEHPWGRLRRNSPPSEGWCSPEAVLSRQQASRFMACGNAGDEDLPGCLKHGDPHGPFAVFGSIAKLATRSSLGQFLNETGSCLAGDFIEKAGSAMDGDRMGRLYGVNIIEEWTEDVTSQIPDLHGNERAVEIYFNASTWNPYQVVLFKTQLRGEPRRNPHFQAP